jgi:hypothetical protein
MAGGARKHFNKEFLAQFEDEHLKALGSGKPQLGGLPDMGNGRYGEKLPYD